MSKIVFLDVDGTLIDYETKLPDSARKAVDQARAHGHKVYICTGCSKDEILQRNLCELDGMILGNGTYVEDHDHVIMHQAMPLEEVKKVVHWCQERNLAFYLETNSGVYCNDQMIKDGPAVMIKYGQGKGADLSNATEKMDEMDIYGLDLPEYWYHKFWEKRDFSKEEVEKLLGSPKKDTFSILIAHNPEYFPYYAAWGADLTVSGHIHGGIMRLPRIGGVISPSLRLFPKYDSGEFEENEKKMILSRGMGLHHVKLRFFNRPEISVIKITCQDKSK